jgi:hypothetical protein
MDGTPHRREHPVARFVADTNRIVAVGDYGIVITDP